MRTKDIGTTSNNGKKTWWYVDLGGVYSVYNIRILFMNYTGESKYVCPYGVTVKFICYKVKLTFTLLFVF